MRVQKSRVEKKVHSAQVQKVLEREREGTNLCNKLMNFDTEVGNRLQCSN